MPGLKFPAYLVVNGRVPPSKPKVQGVSSEGKETVQMPKFKQFDHVLAFLNRADFDGSTELVDHGNKNLKKLIGKDGSIEFNMLK